MHLIRRPIAMNTPVTNGKNAIDPCHLADLLIREHADISAFGRLVIIDCRRFLDYSTSHIRSAINVCCSKLIRKRLLENKMSVFDFLQKSATPETEMETENTISSSGTSSHLMDLVLYADRCRTANGRLDHCSIRKCQDDVSFLGMLTEKLIASSQFGSVKILKGGFADFQSRYPELCEGASGGLGVMGSSGGSVRSTTLGGPSGLNVSSKLTLSTLSQPCLPVSNQGPTRILPFLYLGSQQDAMDQEVLGKYGIDYILNLSVSCPKPDFVQEEHFMRIAVNDSHQEKLLPYFERAFEFLDKVREANSCVLVHCLAGISRSPTLAIAFVMRHLHMSSEEAYRYVKEKRPAISPNFNFLGQLLEYEKQLLSVRSNEHQSQSAGPGLRQGFNNSLSPTVKATTITSTTSSTSRVQITCAENPLFRTSLPAPPAGISKQRRPSRRVSISEKEEDQALTCPQTAPVVNHDFITA